MSKLNIHELTDRINQSESAKANLRKCKKHEAKKQVKAYPAGDGKTVFYCTSPERGAERVAEYQRRLNKFTGL